LIHKFPLKNRYSFTFLEHSQSLSLHTIMSIQHINLRATFCVNVKFWLFEDIEFSINWVHLCFGVNFQEFLLSFIKKNEVLYIQRIYYYLLKCLLLHFFFFFTFLNFFEKIVQTAEI
jgi:hypothetical protein